MRKRCHFTLEGVLPFAAIALAALGAVFSMYRGKDLIWGPDATLPLNLREVSRYIHVVDGSLGAPDVRKLPFLAPIGGLLDLWRMTGLPYSPSAFQHVLVWGLLAGGGLSIYWLSRVFFEGIRRSSALAAALFYMFNLYALTTIWTPLSNLTFHYSLFPAVLVLWHRTLQKESWRWALGTAALWTLTVTPAYTTTPVVVTDFVVLGAVLLHHLIRSGIRRRIFPTVLVMAGSWLLLNSFWLVPTILYLPAETSRGLAQGTPQDLFRLNSAPLGEAIRLGGYWGLAGAYKGSQYFRWGSFYEGGAGLLGYVMPVLASVAILWRGNRRQPAYCPSCGAKQERAGSQKRSVCPACEEQALVRIRLSDSASHAKFFAVFLVVSLVLVTGANAPFGSLKVWLMSHAELFGPYRSAYQRFMVYVAMAYAPLIALGVDVIASSPSTFFRGARRRLVSGLQVGIALAMTVMLALVLAWPLWTPAYTGESGIIPSRRVDIPPEYSQVSEWISQQVGDFNVLVLPNSPGLLTALDWSDGSSGYLGVEPLSLMLDRELVSQDASAPYLAALITQAAGGGPRAGPALRLLNVRYLVVHSDVNREYVKGLNDWIGANVSSVRQAMGRTSSLREVVSEGGLAVYEVTDWQPFRLFAAQSYSGQSLFALPLNRVRALPYRTLGPGRLQFSASDVKPGEIAVLNAPYDTQWRAGNVRPFNAAPGLTAFDVSGELGSVGVRHLLQDRFPLLLVTLPIGLALCLLGWVFMFRRRSLRTPDEAMK